MTHTAYDCFAVQTSTGHAGRQDGQAEGERRKSAAHALLMARRAALIRRAQRALLLAVLERGHGTADDVAAAVDVPPGVDARLLGAAPGTLARAGLLRIAGYTRSQRATRHASVIAVWTLEDFDAAIAWLDAHPPLSELKTARQIELEFTNDEPATVAAAAGSF